MEYKCAPGKKLSHGSCFTLDQLIKISKSYNNIHSDKIIIKDDKKYLLKELNSKLKKKYNCDDQLCWLNTNIIKSLNSKDINFFTFRPDGPETKSDWLSTTNINDVMFQYEKKYSDFKFLGAVPYDFEELKFLEVYDLNLNELKKNNKNRVGMVVNLDEHYKQGSHWVAVYANLLDNKIYFFDSFAKRPKKRLKRFFGKILSYMYDKEYSKKVNYEKIVNDHPSLNSFDIRYNKIQHQFKNSECGVYSMNFIIRLLHGESFDEIVNNITKDDEMQKCRNVYFR